MSFPKITFRVHETNECPLFRKGDLLSVSGVAVFVEGEEENSFVTTTVVRLPAHRENCKILSSDLIRIIIDHEKVEQISDSMMNCSGCSGSISLEYSKERRLPEDESEDDGNPLTSMMHLLSTFPFFRHIDRGDLGDVVRSFKLREYKRDEIVIRKGDQGDTFYIVASGQVNILNEAGLAIATLGVGEVFGEMSLLSEDNASATVQTGAASEILYVANKDFKKILKKYPVLQNYFTRLLANRLSQANTLKMDDYAMGITGQFEEIPPEVLFQTLNTGGKTGILTVTRLQKGTARFSLRQGALIKANYGDKKGKAAFYALLREKEGHYKFVPGLPPEDFDAPEIGSFKKMLLEGLKRMNEQYNL